MIPRSWGNSQIIVKGYTWLGKLRLAGYYFSCISTTPAFLSVFILSAACCEV